MLFYQPVFLLLLSLINVGLCSNLQEKIAAILDVALRKDPALRGFVNALNSVDDKIETATNKKLNFRKWTQPNDWIPKYKAMRTKYDFIIVGSGSSGSVIANRLSEIHHWKILLIEVGTTENFLADIPLLAPAFQYTPYNWEYFMEYQPGICQGLVNQRMHWPRGKAVGGTSVINYMIYTRGNAVDFDNWAAQGNPGWSYKDVLPYYIKAENSTLNIEDTYYHGHDGPLSVSDVYQSPLVTAFQQGCEELGIPNIDYNSPSARPYAASTIQATVKFGRRHSAARAYLEPVKHRKNLHILTEAFVTKVLIDHHSRKAYGVEYEKDGKKYRVGASKEVILSAGTFNSPQLLMLAGIGPKEHLEELGIPVLEDLPVGQNLHDHLTFPGLSFIINKPVSISPTNVITPDSLFSFLFNGTGPLTSLGGVEGIGYIRTPYTREQGPQPDMELLFVGGTLASDNGIVTRQGMRITDEVYDGLLRPLHRYPQWTIFPMHVHPKSTGYMKLRSRNPKDFPKFYGQFFTDPQNEDVKAFIYAVRFIQKLAQTTPFAHLGSQLNPNRQPGCELYEFDSDAYWECCIRAISVTLHHQVGTAKMGPPEDPTSVVNNELKVYGVSGLRVADCSIIPFALSAHTNAPAIMVGEKASDLIKETWLSQEKEHQNYYEYDNYQKK